MRVLYITYFYPPLGGPAVLRNLKTVKYLSRAGHSIDVITTRDIEYLYRDASLMEECGHRELIRTASLDPMALFRELAKPGSTKASHLYMNTPERLKLMIRRAWPIDNKIGWVPFIINAGRKAMRRNVYDLIYISLGPFSSGLGAYHLSRSSGIPLVVDMRDYWNLLGDYELQGSALHRAWSRAWERRIYRHASLIVTATKGIGTDIDAFVPGSAAKSITVYNGWDEEDFQGLTHGRSSAGFAPASTEPQTPPSAASKEGFVLSYFGNIYARRSLVKFFCAVRTMREQQELPANTSIRLYGNFFRETIQEVENSGIKDIIRIIPQLEHRAALQAMLDSDALLLTLNSSGPKGTLSSKVFEYLRAQRPILAMVPAHNEAAELLKANGQDYICAMESAVSIRYTLHRLISERKGPAAFPIPYALERRWQIAKLSEALSHF